MTNQILFSEDGRKKLLVGVDKLSNSVKITLGADGKNVIVGNDYGIPFITKDGVTVAKSIVLDDYIENMGASLVKQVASKTADEAGDGSTTSVILVQSILQNGIKAIADGHNQRLLIDGINAARNVAIAKLREISKPIDTDEQLINIASISANNDKEIGNLIAEAVSHVGVNGTVTVINSENEKTYVSKTNGITVKQGFVREEFALNYPNGKVVLENPYILLYNDKIKTMSEILPLLKLVRESERPLLVIADDVEGEALKSILVNVMQGSINVCCVKSPGFGDNKFVMMNDIATMVGGKFISESLGIKIENATLADLGSAKRVEITKDKTVIIEGNANDKLLSERVSQIEENIKTPNGQDIKFLKHRLYNLTKGIATVSVGGYSETEVGEKKDRIDDAIRSTICALEEGYLIGGGVALLNCFHELDSLSDKNRENLAFRMGVEILILAIYEPFMQILHNAGVLECQDKISEIIIYGEYGLGFNAKTKVMENLFDAGVLDPTKVTTKALENAVSIACIFLTTDCIISNISEL